MPGSSAGRDSIPDEPGRDIDDDTARAILDVLRVHGADGLRHGHGRTLLDHLVGTYLIVRSWREPVWLQHAALIHSVYGTDAYDEQLFLLSARRELATVAGDQAERLAYLFCVTPRAPLLAGTHRWARELPQRFENRHRDQPLAPANSDELAALVLLHMANLAEQARAPDGSPGRWLARIGALADLVGDAEGVTPPVFSTHLATFSEVDESLARRVYRDAIGRADDPDARARRFGLAAAVCPVVAEPCVWLAYLSRLKEDFITCRSWAAHARNRLLELGTPWDKRLTLRAWHTIIDALELPEGHCRLAPETIAHPRALFETVANRTGAARSTASASSRSRLAIKPPDAAAGNKRFQRYVEALGAGDGPRPGAVYPDLVGQPWHNPADFALVTYLESNYPAIRDEIFALGAARFHRESERIKRAGDWDVAFLYERGRRHDELCAMCPVTARGVDTYPTMRTSAGLIYVSRMRAATHIEAHRGPTNLRVRCHLAIQAPAGDCGIRVGDETRRWHEGKCLVFDDYFEHEAWNHTEEDRVVLIVDLWHPGLSATEVALLEGLHAYTHAYAQTLSRYWAANAAVSRRVSGGH
jgi:Aspartyl/Asparaginyl beta-hydroxylase